MLTDGEPTAAYDAGGAGGKFRKRPLRRPQATPYDRPPTALRNPSWLTKLVVDPASKLINAGAQRFLAPLFRKRLPPPLHSPPTPERRQESIDVLQDSGPNNHSGVLQPTVHESNGTAYHSDSNAFSELEQLLKQKTFTRCEIGRLTKLLHSKVVDASIGDCDRRVEADYSTPAPVLSGGLLEENKTERLTSRGVFTTPVISSKIHENDVASPAELAKSFMDSRPSKVSPSTLSLRSQAVRKDASLLKMVPYDSKSPIISLANRPIGRVGVPENGFNTSRSRGRSAIYSMARTPYSRVRATNKASGSMDYVFGRPSSSQSVVEHDESFQSKQVSGKRRNSVLDDDLGSGGPIRRIRQKPNLLSHEVSGVSKHHLHLTQKVSNFVEENPDYRTPSTSCAHVPNKSCETAAKILEHLDKLTPKKKSSESKLASLKEKSPSKLTSMVDGQGVRIHEGSDSLKLLQNVRDSYKSEDHFSAATPDSHISGLPKLDVVKENGTKKLVDMANPLSNNELMHQNFVTPERKHAYKTSSYENAFQLHHDVQSIGSAPKPVTKVITKAEISLVGSTQFISKELSGDKASTSPEFRTPLGFLSKRTSEVTPDGVIKGVKNSCSPTSVDAHQSPEVTQSTLVSDKLEQTYSNKVLSTAFSLPSVTETKGSSSIFWNGSKPESSSSPANLAPDQTDSQKADNVDVPFVASIATSATFFSSKSAPSNTSSVCNGQLSPSNGFSSTSILASSNCENHGGFTTSGPSEAATFTTSVTATNVTASTSASGGSSIFAGVSLAAVRPECSTFAGNSSAASFSTGNLFQSTVFNAGGSVDNAKPTLPGFGSATGLQQITTTQFGSSMSALVSGTSGLTSFGSTGSSTTPFSSGAMFGPTSTASSESNLTGSSSAVISNVFSFGSSSSAASSTAAAPFTFSFGASSTTSSPETKPLASFSGATPGVFNFGSSSVASSSSSATAAVFNFGGSSVASSSTNVTTTGFGFNGTASPSSISATPGGTSTSSISLFSAGSNATPGTFTFHASSSTGSQSTPMTSSSAGVGIFGSGWQSPAFGSSPSPTGFTFGATSSSFSTSNTAPMAFGSSLGASSSPAFTFAAASSTSASPSMLGSSTATFDAAPGNDEQMNMEDSSMAEDPVQSSAPTVSVFGQAASSSPPSSVTFGSMVPLSNTFQFGGQQNPATPQNSSLFQATVPTPNPFQFSGQQNPAAPPSPSPSPFQPPGSLGFSTGGSFSLGSSGNDKSGRRIVKINRNKNRRK
ncbi:PREDICTED: nuclear pore complex protein NUP1-like isoform X2 [Ipomoea nil]|uniref:nuclear pore complex protein NUP1-like isoform X2 n=1 Tax=Ipomoea nil TaxID=35883 RepID=UPI00090171B9|nr:PREDICTED: nuclear pore complex protein NUP1-like isoform X2 [Ipomoea nil]